MSSRWLIYHPKREISVLGNTLVYHDPFGNNEDPYLWNKHFLHTFCHITEMKNIEGQINFWVSGDTYPNISKLYCDCVFVIQCKQYWKMANKISREDTIIDNKNTFEHHYKWGNLQKGQGHYFARKRRYTLKADPEKSFQPQTREQKLIDIIPFLNSRGIQTIDLIRRMAKKQGSKPFELPSIVGDGLYDFLYSKSEIKLRGRDIEGLRNLV